MTSNSTVLNSYDASDPSLILQIICVVPEYFNLFFLSCALYGMYQGIEIAHPLYAVLFLNLIIPLISTIFDIIVFFFISSVSYVKFSNAMNGLSLFFHCTSWCVTSLLRFVYIIYGDWFNNLVPTPKLQCTLAIILSLVMTSMQSIPPFAVAISFGKYNYFISQHLLMPWLSGYDNGLIMV